LAKTTQRWVLVVSIEDCITHAVWMMDHSLGAAQQGKKLYWSEWDSSY